MKKLIVATLSLFVVTMSAIPATAGEIDWELEIAPVLSIVEATPEADRPELISQMSSVQLEAIRLHSTIDRIEFETTASDCPPDCNLPPAPDCGELGTPCPNHEAVAVGTMGFAGANLAPGCYEWNPYLRLEAKNFWGATLWTYGNDIQWCIDGTVITYVGNTPKVTMHSPFWSFGGTTTNSIYGGTGTVGFTSFVQGKFNACVLSNIGCYYQSTPWLEIQGSGAGAWRYAGGG